MITCNGLLSEQTIKGEIGYTRDEAIATEMGMSKFWYGWRHADGREGDHFAFCLSERDFMLLLDRWNYVGSGYTFFASRTAG